AGSELFRGLTICASLVLVSGKAGEHSVRAESFDRLERQVRVVRQVTGEIVRAKLIRRVEAGALEVLRPLFEQAPVLLREGCVSFRLRQSRYQNQEVARFLHR